MKTRKIEIEFGENNGSLMAVFTKENSEQSAVVSVPEEKIEDPIARRRLTVQKLMSSVEQFLSREVFPKETMRYKKVADEHGVRMVADGYPE